MSCSHPSRGLFAALVPALATRKLPHSDTGARLAQPHLRLHSRRWVDTAHIWCILDKRTALRRVARVELVCGL